MARDKEPKAGKAKRPSKAAKAKRAPRKAPSSRFFRNRLKKMKKKDREQGLDDSQSHPEEAEGSSAEAQPDARETDERQDEASQPEPVEAAAQGADDPAEARAEAATEATAPPPGEAGESSGPDDEAVQAGRQEPGEAGPAPSEQDELGDAAEEPQESPEPSDEPEVQASAEPADDAEQGSEEPAEPAEEPAPEGEQPEAERLSDPADPQEEPQAAAEEEGQEQPPAVAEETPEEAAEERAAGEAADLNGPSLQEILDQQREHLARKRTRMVEGVRQAQQLEPDEGPPQAEEAVPPEPAAEDEPPEPEPAEEEQAQEQPAEEQPAQEQPSEPPAKEGDEPSPAQLIAAALADRPADPGADTAAEPAPPRADIGEPSRASAGGLAQPAHTKRRIGLIGIVLLSNSLLVILIVAVLIGLYLRRGQDISSVQRAQAVQAEPTPAPALPDASGRGGGPREPVSWPMAENAFQSKRYAEALRRYRRLLEASQAVPSEDMVSDFCRLRTADCLWQLGKGAEARELLVKVTRSRSPIARGLACYRLAVADLDGGQLLQARMKAYQALAVLGALPDAGAVEADCHYLVCQALTVKALSSHNLDVGVDWGAAEHADMFAGLDEPALRELLRRGAHQLAQAVLGPQVREVESDAPGPRLAASCAHSPLEELLQRIATEAEEDVRWMSVDSKARRRMVTVCFRSVSAQRLSEVACASAGLVARFTGEQIHVHDPQSAASLTDQRELILREAESAWRRFFLRAPKDPRIARGRFALANLCEAAGNPLGAIREYQLLAHRFSDDPVAPEALLRSARARTAIRDYAGARKDLLELLDRHPGFQSSDKVYLYLGEATMNSGLHEKAAGVFSKLYHLNLTPDSRREASFGAGKCLYRKGEYKEASKWLVRYIRLVKVPSPQLAEAYFLLARSESHQGNLDGAAQAMRAALAAKPPPKRRAEVLMELARIEVQRQRFVPAVAALSRIQKEQLDQEQLAEFLLLSSQVYRSMDLPEKALSLLRREIKGVSDPQARAELEVEIAKCLADGGELNAARELLAKTLPALKAGRKAHLAACELAQVCLASGKADQAVTVSRELLKASCQPDIRRRAQAILGAAYLDLKDYERAALAFSGMAVKRPGAKDK